MFDGEKFGAKEISFVFKEKDTFSVSLSTGVDFNTVFINRLAQELQYLAWVLRGGGEYAT